MDYDEEPWAQSVAAHDIHHHSADVRPSPASEINHKTNTL